MALAPPWRDDIERAETQAKRTKPEYRGDDLNECIAVDLVGAI